MQRLACLLLAGSATAIHLHKYKGLETERSKQPFHFQHHETVQVADPYYGALNKSTFRAPPIKLMNGEAWFTLPNVNRLPLPTPGVPYAITAFNPDIYDEFGGRPSLGELYDHHWLVYDRDVGGSGDNLGCGGEDTFVSNIVGAGAEMRAINYSYPGGYGYFSTEGTETPHWTGNLHFINVKDLSAEHFQDQPDPAGAATKACIECNWSPGNTGIACIKGSMGNFGCCVDGGRCLTNNMDNKTKTTYYLTYDIYWTTDMSLVKPVQYGVVDTFACASLGNVKPNMKTKTHTCDDRVCVGEIEREMDKDTTLLFSYIHQHVGAINGTLFLNGKEICTSYPEYGTDRSNPIGNEAGFINKWNLCLDADFRQNAKHGPLRVKKGDKLKWRSLYNVEEVDERILPMPGGAHGGVMGLGYFLMSPDNAYKCQDGQCVGVTQGVDIDTCRAAC